MNIDGRFYADGEAEGSALVLSEPLSFFGGIDVETGRIIAQSHPERDASVAGRILVMAGGRGSSSSSSILAEAIRRGTAPLAIVLGRPDGILTVGSLVASSLYQRQCPIVVCPIERVRMGDHVRISAGPARQAYVRVTSQGDALPQSSTGTV